MEEIRHEDLERAIAGINASLPVYKLALAPLDKLMPREKNARHMSRETFSRLVSNIEKDGALGSLPLCRRIDEGYELISGHHRVKAALAAGVKEALILYVDRELTEQEVTAMQLSHNALVGTDDVLQLLEMAASLNDPRLLEYAAVDMQIPLPAATMLLPMTEARLMLRPVVFYLEDAETQTLEEFVQEYNSRPLVEGEQGYVVLAKVWDEFIVGLAELAERHKLASANHALSEVISLMKGSLNAAQEG